MNYDAAAARHLAYARAVRDAYERIVRAGSERPSRPACAAEGDHDASTGLSLTRSPAAPTPAGRASAAVPLDLTLVGYCGPIVSYRLGAYRMEWPR